MAAKNRLIRRSKSVSFACSEWLESPRPIVVSASLLLIAVFLRASASQFAVDSYAQNLDGVGNDISSTELRDAETQSPTFPDVVERRLNTRVDLDVRFSKGNQRQTGSRIIGLVEVRNIAHAARLFFSALAPLVDAIVVLDDHSSDNTVLEIERLAHDTSIAPVEVLLTKKGSWVRNELRDRQLLLSYGRSLGGTHFVLPDYDELFSANCVSNGRLRSEIQRLKPGESLFLSWVELWSNTSSSRVLAVDRSMNFLKRRQTIVFADDGKAEYDNESSKARSLNGSGASIHVLRCPRTLCPAPLPYVGPSSIISHDPRVKYLPECRIIEARFLNLDNVLSKSAWYEVLGRISNAPDGVTSGKMVTLMFGNDVDNAEFETAEIDNAWIEGYEGALARALDRVESWRMDEMVEWRHREGVPKFDGLAAHGQIDFSAYEMERRKFAFQEENVALREVPRLAKRGSLLLIDVLRNRERVLLEKFATALGGVPVGGKSHRNVERADSHASTVGTPDCETLTELNSVRLAEIAKESSSWLPFVAPCESNSLATLEAANVLAQTADGFEVVVLRVRTEPIVSEEDAAANEIMYQPRASSLRRNRLRVLHLPARMLGSIAGLSTIALRLIGPGRSAWSGREVDPDWRGLVDLVEDWNKHDLKSATLVPNESNGRIPSARLVFSLNVGRSGSKYLASLFETIGRDGIVSLHEPRCPHGYCSGGGAMRMQNISLESTYEDRRNMKLGMIRDAIADNLSRRGPSFRSRLLRYRSEVLSELLRTHRLPGDDRAKDEEKQLRRRSILEFDSVHGWIEHSFDDIVYVETNPNFKSWFYDVVLDELPNAGYWVDVIVLRRHLASVTKSLVSTGYFVDRDGYNWMETCNGVNSKMQALDDDSRLDAVDKVISYALNAEAVSRYVMEQYAHSARFFEMRSETVFTSQGSIDLLQRLGMRVSARTIAQAGRRVDKYEARETPAIVDGAAITVEYVEQRISEYLSRCATRGIAVPELVHLGKDVSVP